MNTIKRLGSLGMLAAFLLVLTSSCQRKMGCPSQISYEAPAQEIPSEYGWERS